MQSIVNLRKNFINQVQELEFPSAIRRTDGKVFIVITFVITFHHFIIITFVITFHHFCHRDYIYTSHCLHKIQRILGDINEHYQEGLTLALLTTTLEISRLRVKCRFLPISSSSSSSLCLGWIVGWVWKVRPLHFQPPKV